MSRLRLSFALSFLSLAALTAHCGSDDADAGGAPDASIDHDGADAPAAPAPDASAPDADASALDATLPSDASDAFDTADSKDSAGPKDASDGSADAACGQVLCDGACVNVENDPQHCGSCDSRCASGETCSPVLWDAGFTRPECMCPTCGPREVIGTHNQQNTLNGNMAIGGGVLYISNWTSIEQFALPAAPSPTAPQTIFDEAVFDAGSSAANDKFGGLGLLSLVGGRLYVAAQGGAVFALTPDAAHANPTEATLTVADFFIRGMTADDAYVYYANSDHDTIWRVPGTGGVGKILFAYEQGTRAMAGAGDRIVWAIPGKLRWGAKTGGNAHDLVTTYGETVLAAAGNTVFFADSRSVSKYDIATETVTVLAPVDEGAHGIFATASRVFWTESRGAVRVVGVDGTGEHTVSVSGSDPWSVVADDTYAYWYDSETQSIVRARY